MPLVPFDEIMAIASCPRCREPLSRDAAVVMCTSPRCTLVGAFPSWGGRPVLVDFERSILSPDVLREAPAPLRRPLLDRAPELVRRWWRPPNKIAAANIDKLLGHVTTDAPTLLVVGGGAVGSGAARLYDLPRLRVIGFDIYPSPITQFVADAHQIPLRDATVDAVVVQAVLEHVLEPNTVVAEIHRVLRPHGVVYAETPFLQQVHAGPYDFTRYTSSGHRYLFRRFEEIDAGPVAGAGTQLLWSLDHLTRGLLRSHTAGRATRAAFFWLRYLDRAVSPEFAMDSASAYYFLGRRGESSLQPRELVRYYRGAQR